METLFKSILFVRFCSLFLVQTWFVPDEYWQSLEVSHYLVFNYGYLTWEWCAGIRSILYPALVAIPYSLVKLLGLHNLLVLVTVPRILQMTITVWAEWRFTQSIRRSFKSDEVKWLVFLNCGSYFLFYIGSRNLANTLEMNLVLLGIAYFAENQYGHFFLIISLSCYTRPTCLPIWLPFMVYFLIAKRAWLTSVQNLPSFIKCFIAVVVFIILDSMWYRKLILVPLEFLRFNFMNDFAKFYGEHPWHWYLSNALPSLFGPFLVFAVIALWKERNYPKQGILRYLIKLSCLAYIFAHSFVGHKEIRFLTPVIPLLNYIIVPVISHLRPTRKKAFAIAYLAINIPVALYLGLRHQRGVLDAVDYLANHITSNDTAIFLMPCHSTPLYSHIHVNATLRFLTCPPNLENYPAYQDEADIFYSDSKKWVSRHMPDIKPNFVVLFDVLYQELANYLNSTDFALVASFFHADFAQGRVSKRVLIFQRKSTVEDFAVS